MGNSSKRRYDGKHRVTRILLADYLVLKEYSQKTGESMAEALHTIITRDWAMAHKGQPVAQPVLSVTTPIALRHRLSPVIATNGNKAIAFRIKTKGVRYE